MTNARANMEIAIFALLVALPALRIGYRLGFASAMRAAERALARHLATCGGGKDDDV